MAREYIKGSFVIVPNYDWIQLMTGGTVKIYLALCKYSNDQGQCYPSQVTIAKRAGLSRMQVSRAIKELKEMGLITIVPQQRTDGGWTNNLYQLQTKTPSNMGDTGGYHMDVTLTLPRRNSKEKGLSKLTIRKDIKEGYERLVRHSKQDSL